MNRARVAILAVSSLLLISGSPQPAAQSVAGGTPDPTVEESFGEAQIERFLRQANPALSKTDVRRTSAAILRYSGKYQLDPMLVTQVIWVESGARPWVRSPLGAVGLMQVMPHMAAPLELSGSLASIESNIEAGCWILADNIRRLGEEDGISAYFWGSDIRSVSYLHRVQRARATIRGFSES
jgi:soluble lytic murein transglycosylase-like protein